MTTSHSDVEKLAEELFEIAEEHLSRDLGPIPHRKFKNISPVAQDLYRKYARHCLKEES